MRLPADAKDALIRPGHCAVACSVIYRTDAEAFDEAMEDDATGFQHCWLLRR